MYIVFKGIRYRVKFTITELEVTKFCVEVLDNKYDKNTKFSTVGKLEYYGSDFWEAWAAVQKYMFNAVLPRKFEKYIHGSYNVK